MWTAYVPTHAPENRLHLEARTEIFSTLHGALADSPHPNRRIRLYHPHYPFPTNLLLNLHAPDGGPKGGLDYTVAHTACGLVAGNRWDGYFTHDVEGRQRLQLKHGEIMPLGGYFFHLDDSSAEDPYAVFPTFRTWKFPHNRLPPLWSPEISRRPEPAPKSRSYAPSSFQDAVFIENSSCRISDTREATQVAHLCPEAEHDWAQRNGMGMYDTNAAVPVEEQLNDTSNALLLRMDLHTLFDGNKFVFTPKMDQEGAVVILIHVLETCPELEHFYHNVRLKPVPNVHQSYLLTRFAWSIFKFFEPFISNSDVNRKLIINSNVPRMFPASECLNLIYEDRNGRPKKEKRSISEDEFSSDCQHRGQRQRIDQISSESSGDQSQVAAMEGVQT